LNRAGLRAAGHGFLWVLENIGAAILIFMTGLITVEVVGRTLFGYSTGFTYEVLGALTGCVGFAGLASTFRKGDHVRILALVSRAPRGLQGGLDVVAHVLALVYACVLLLYGGRFALSSLRAGERSWAAFPFAIYPFKLLVFIGLLAFTGVVVLQLYTLISKGRQTEPRSMPPEK
jgi:TRAP-type C4-dicarboxylate transport system permease small subunit